MSEWDRLAQEDLDAFAALTSVEWFVDLDVERSKRARFDVMIARGYDPRAPGRASRGRARRRRS